MIRYIFGHNRSGTNERISPDRNATQNSRISPQCGSSHYKRLLELLHTRDLAPRIEDVCKNHRGTTEDMVFERYTFIHRHVVLNLNPITDCDMRADDDILADLAVLPDTRSFQDVGRMPDARSFADLDAFIDESRFVSKVRLVRLRSRTRQVRSGLFQCLLAPLQHG